MMNEVYLYTFRNKIASFPGNKNIVKLKYYGMLRNKFKNKYQIIVNVNVLFVTAYLWEK